MVSEVRGEQHALPKIGESLNLARKIPFLSPQGLITKHIATHNHYRNFDFTTWISIKG